MPEPQIIWSRTIQDAEGDDVTVDAYSDGDVRITIQERLSGLRGHGEAVFSREGRGEFDRAYQEACRRADGEPSALTVASVDPGDAEAFGQALDQLAEGAQRMAIDPDGIVKSVAEFSAEEKWWCEGEDCDDYMTEPHVHCQMHVHRVDLITGHSDNHPGHAADAGPGAGKEASDA